MTRQRGSALWALLGVLLLTRCGGRTALLGGEDTATNGGVAGQSTPPVTGMGGGGLGNVAGAGCISCGRGGTDARGGSGGDAAGQAGTDEGGAAGSNDTLTIVGDQPVSTPSALVPPIPQRVTPLPALSVSCGTDNCLVLWASELSARFARVTFDGKWLDPAEGRYVGRVVDGMDDSPPVGIATASDGAHFVLLWQQFSQYRRRWVVQRVQASSGEFVESEPIPLSDWASTQERTAALSWDGAKYLAVLPQGTDADIVLLDPALHTSPGLRYRVSMNTSFERVSAASAVQGEFVVVWSNFTDQPSNAGSSRFTYTDAALTASGFPLPPAPQQESPGLDARPNQYLLSWQQSADPALHLATRAALGTTWNTGSAFSASATDFTYSDGAFVGVNSADPIMRLDPQSLLALPAPTSVDHGHTGRVAATPKNSVILAHFHDTGTLYVHVLTRTAESAASSDVGREAGEQKLLSLASDGSSYLVAWLETGRIRLRQFRPDMTPVDDAWVLPVLGSPVPDLFQLGYANGHFVAVWWFEPNPTRNVPVAGTVDPVSHQLSHLQALGPSTLEPQELMSDGSRAWVTLVEQGTKLVDGYSAEAWLRVATLEPGSTAFTLSDRLSPDGLALMNGSFTPIKTGYVGAWWEAGANQLWPISTLHAAGYDSARQVLGTESIGTDWPAERGWANETISGVRVAGSSTSPNALFIADDTYFNRLRIGLTNADTPSRPLPSTQMLDWFTETPPSVLELRSGCWAVSGFVVSKGQDANGGTYRFCDRAGSLVSASSERWALGGERSMGGTERGFHGATHDQQHVGFAFDVTDPVLNANRVRFVVLTPK